MWQGVWRWVWLPLGSGKFLGGQVGGGGELSLQVPLLRRRFPPTLLLRKRPDRSSSALGAASLSRVSKGGLGRGGAAAGRRGGGAALVTRLPPGGGRGPGRAHRVAGARARPRPFLLALAAPPPPRAASAAGGGDSPLRRPETRRHRMLRGCGVRGAGPAGVRGSRRRERGWVASEAGLQRREAAGAAAGGE